MEFAKPRVSNIRNSNIRDLFTKVSKRKIGAQYLAEVRLSKIRRYSEATIRFDFPVTALIGTNGGGKSTVLGAAGLIYRSVAPRTFFAKSGKYDQSMQDWTLIYEHWDQQGKLVVRTARYSKARWDRDPIDRPVVLLGVSRTLPATERKRLTAAIGNKFTGAAERPLSQDAQDNVEKILGRDISSYITVDIDGLGQEDRQFFASQSEQGDSYSEFHFGAGEASIIRIVQRVEEAERGALILIEEIENGLHPVATRLLVDYLIDAAKRKAVQIIFTTHSDAAIAGLPDDAIWACVDGNLSQGRLQVSALRALTGEVQVGAALFVEDSFSEAMLESAVRSYCQRHDGISPQGVGIYPVGGAHRAAGIVAQHNIDPSISNAGASESLNFPAVAVLDGDCRGKKEFESSAHTYFLPGEVPESYVFDAVDKCLEDVSKLLMRKLGISAISELEFISGIRKVDSLCRDPHVIFSMIGDRFDFIAEQKVVDAFLSTWCESYPEVVDALVSPLVSYFPDCPSSDDMVH